VLAVGIPVIELQDITPPFPVLWLWFNNQLSKLTPEKVIFAGAIFILADNDKPLTVLVKGTKSPDTPPVTCTHCPPPAVPCLP